MKQEKEKEKKSSDLRKRAEALLHHEEGRSQSLSDGEVRYLIQELQTHQIELEMQNDELRRTQELLEKSRVKYSHLFDFAPIGYFNLDAKGHIIEVNLAGADQLGVNRGSLMDRSFSQFIQRDDQDRFYLHWNQVFDTKKQQNCDIRLKNKNGTVFYAHLESLPVEDSNGLIRQCRTAVIDITKRKEAEEALLSHERQQEAVAVLGRMALAKIDFSELLEEAVRLIARHLDVEYCNILELLPDGKRLLMRSGVGWKQGSVGQVTVGTGDDSLTGYTLHSKDPVIVADLKKETRFHGPPLLTDHGVVSGISVIIGEPNRPFGILGAYTTQPRTFSKDNIHFFQAMSNVMTAYIKNKQWEEEHLKIAKLESVGLLAGGLAHDFNNLLTSILGNISLAKMLAENGEDVLGNLTDAEKASLRARDLTQQLLTFSRGGAPVKKTASIGELIQDTVIFALRGSNLECLFSIPEDLRPVDVDSGQISQVITNLAINAKQAMPIGGTLQINCENVNLGNKETLPLKQGRYVKISIQDHGYGIPKEHVSKIFDPYFTTKQKGSGLGLATAYSIIKKHDGLLTAESTEGEGTTFRITLPASQKELKTEETLEENLPTGQGKILVMDDEETIRKVAGKILCSIGYEVDYASDGEEAIVLYKKAKETGHPFDVVIMDLTIPGKMGGKEAINKLLEIDPDVKAVVSSGYSNDPIMAEYKKHGFRDVIAKPYKIKELSLVVNHVLRGLST